MGIASIIVGIAALILYLITLIPYLGWLNIIVIPLAIVGLVLGFLGRTITLVQGAAAIGIVVNAIVLVLGILRLF